ncbi:MAG: SET domain-containing protein, partial [Deltaproteobacteria bacterium]|nr:SET domain-containing protein [Deltaproteobacteria bacterium]
MLSVKTKVRNSEINGLGVFAAEDIPAGAVVWEYHPQFEHEISEEELLKLSEVQRIFWFHYGYYDLSRG